MGSPNFFVLSTPATPLAVGAGEEIEFTFVYTPTVAGVLDVATIRIISNDPFAPFIDLSATGCAGRPRRQPPSPTTQLRKRLPRTIGL
jgi:hypothetical protein